MGKPVSGVKRLLASLIRLLSAAALMLSAFAAQAEVGLTNLYSFPARLNGAHPLAGLARGSDGNFYGTTPEGGVYNAGTVFVISPTGALTNLYSFTGAMDGLSPIGGVIQGTDGDFYGTTADGGIHNAGTVFKITPAGVLTTLYLFTGAMDSENPVGGLIQGTDGNFYGTTTGNGGFNIGTLFKMTPSGALTSFHWFDDADGNLPLGALVPGYNGSFYGTTELGGAYEEGTVFKISASGALTSLYSFGSRGDGADCATALVLSTDGEFYGTTESGGADGYGTVFTITPYGAYTSLYSFTGGKDGASPQAGLVQISPDIFYGTTQGGGANGQGTLFKIGRAGALTSLYSFSGGEDGASPHGALLPGNDGYFYGTTYGGGTQGLGTVFKITTNGTLTSLYSFTRSNAGRTPSGLAQGNDGSLYGTTKFGGSNDCGMVFKISTAGELTSLYAFSGANDGTSPQGGLVQGSDGNFYGTTESGGTNYDGTVFKISTAGELSTLYSFDSGEDGGFPVTGLVQGNDGNFYGTTKDANGTPGSIFKISVTGALTSLCYLGGNYGASPNKLVQGSDGNFYGTTASGGPYSGGYGTVFQMSANGVLTNLSSFTGADGASPQAALLQDNDGNFYGTTSTGGSGNAGTVFKISSTGALTTLYSFTGGNDGASPQAALVQGSDGNFYGTTSAGGSGGAGTVFEISATGWLSTLYSFTGGQDGANPQTGLVQGSDGYFYGTTVLGGATGFGTVFRFQSSPAILAVGPFQEVVVTNSMFSGNGPLSFTLASNAPAGAVIGADGVFTWAPTCEQGSTTNLITVWATDSGNPPSSNSTTFTVVVGPCVEINVGSSVVPAGQNACLPVSIFTTVSLTNLGFGLSYSGGFLSNWNITPSNSLIASATARTVDASHAVFNVVVQPGNVLQGSSVIGTICLDTLPGASAFVPFAITNMGTVAADNTPITNVIGQFARVLVVGPQPLLEASPGTNSNLLLTLYGNPGVNYDLLTTTNLLDSSSWSMAGSLTLTDFFQVISMGGATNQMQFFKAVKP